MFKTEDLTKPTPEQPRPPLPESIVKGLARNEDLPDDDLPSEFGLSSKGFERKLVFPSLKL